jgi:hypothetical protein
LVLFDRGFRGRLSICIGHILKAILMVADSTLPRSNEMAATIHVAALEAINRMPDGPEGGDG